MQGIIEFEDEVVSQMSNNTNNNPYLLHILCSYLVEKFEIEGRTIVRLPDLHAAVQECVLMGGQTYFAFILGQIAGQRDTLSIIIALSEVQGRFSNWVSLEQLIDATNLTTSDLGRITGHLESCGIIAYRLSSTGKHEYRLSIQYFCDWINRNPSYFCEVVEKVYMSTPRFSYESR
jgi:hypothetical protein